MKKNAKSPCSNALSEPAPELAHLKADCAQSLIRLIAKPLVLLSMVFSSYSSATEKVDLIIENAHVLTMNTERSVFNNGVIVVKKDRILAVGGRELLDSYEADSVIDAGGDIAMPGMINVHNHLPMVAFRGLGENNVKDRLFRFYFPLEKALLSRKLIRISSRHAAIESALSGITLVTDMYYHEDEVARSVAEVGIRGVLGETVIGFPVVDAKEPYGGLAYAEQYIKEWKAHPLVTPAVASHTPYTVSPEWLSKSRELAEREDVPLLMHIAEIPGESDLIRQKIGDFPEEYSVVEYLDALGFLTDRLLAAHVIHVDQEDIALLKKRGVGVAHNPKANTKDSTGMSPAWDMYLAGVDIGFGTDGPLSSNQMDVMNVMGYAAVVARNLGEPDSTRYSPYDLVYTATMGGARALDMDDEIGSLEVNKKADIVLVDIHAVNMQPMYDPYATLAFAAYPGNIRTTIVNGRVIVKDRVVQTVDLAAHAKEWSSLTERVAKFAETLD
ncbi:MAG: amidohydrolase [Pseudomonadales bacterium]